MIAGAAKFRWHTYKPALLVAAIVIGLSILPVFFYYEALFLDRSIIHGDSIIHGYPVLSLLASVVHGDSSPLWTDLIYGGHPIHAEGQLGLFNPLNAFVAYFFSPELGQNVFHCLCLILTSLGMFALCRQMKISCWASLFASISVSFSTLWIDVQHNFTIAGSFIWIPWAIWAFERWLEDPRKYLALTICMFLLAVSGYPQSLHGVAIYIAASLIIHILTKKISNNEQSIDLKVLIRTGLLAAILCFGLSAVQLLPLLELVGLSHRSEGVAAMNSPIDWVARGLLFSPVTAKTSEPYFSILGSVLTCVLASMVILIKPRSNVIRQLAATALMFNLAVGSASPLFSLFYESKIFGLHFFRLSWTYFSIAVIGIALMAAYVVDEFKNIQFGRKTIIIRSAILLIFWAYTIFKLHMTDAPELQYGVAALALAGLLIAKISKKISPRIIGLAMLILVTIEITSLKFDRFNFYSNEILTSVPPSVVFINGQSKKDKYKTIDLTISNAYGMFSPLSPAIEKQTRTALNSLTASSNILWEMPSIQGAHALPLQRRMLIEKTLTKELKNPSRNRAGLRLADFLGIRYISNYKQPRGESISPAFQGDDQKIGIFENTSAHEKFQAFHNYRFVEGADEALSAISSLENKTLIIEANKDAPTFTLQPRTTEVAQAEKIDVIESTPTRYTINMETNTGAWLFIADANYPGWKATLDGRETTVYTAQILGKSIWVPEGKHNINLVFSPTIFWISLGVSLISAIIVGLLLVSRLVHSKDSKLKLTRHSD